MTEATRGRPDEDGRKDALELVDVRGGDWGEPPGAEVVRVAVVSETDDTTGAGVPSEDGFGIWDPLCLRWHDLGRKLPSGAPDRRMSISTVNDYGGDQNPPEPGELLYEQEDFWSSRNRSTRERDRQGRAALPSSLRRIMDSEDGRYALAIRAPGPGQVPPEPEIVPASGDTIEQWPEGIFAFSAGQRLGALGSAPSSGISINGITFFSGAALNAARQMRDAGGDRQQIAAAASAGYRGAPLPPLPERTQTRDEPPPGPARNPQGNVSPSDRPGGYVTDGESIGLLGTLVDPSGFLAPYFLGSEGTPIGTLPLRHDAQVSTGGDNPKVGRIAFSPNEAATVERGSGKLVKGEMWHDSSRANTNTELGNETGEWVPVIAIDAEKISWDAARVPPGVDWRPKPKPDGKKKPLGPTGSPTGSPTAPPGSSGGPGPGPGPGAPGGSPGGPGGISVGGGQWETTPQPGPGRSSGDCPKPAGGSTPKGSKTQPRGGTSEGGNKPATGGTAGGTQPRPATGGGATPRPDGRDFPETPNPESQARDLTPGNGVPCPNRTAGKGRTPAGSGGTASGSASGGGAAGTPDPTGHPAVSPGAGGVILGGSEGDKPPESPPEETPTRAEEQLERWRRGHAEQCEKLEKEIAELRRKAEAAEAEVGALREIGRPNQARWQESVAGQARDRLERAERRLKRLKEQQARREAYYRRKAERSREIRRRQRQATPKGTPKITQGGFAMAIVGADLGDAAISDFQAGDPQGPDFVAATTGQGEWGTENVLTRELPLPGSPGSPVSLQDYLTWAAMKANANSAVINGAFGGPGYLAANLAVIDEGSPTSNATGSVIGTRHAAGPGQQLTVGTGQSALEVISQVRAGAGGKATLTGDGVLSVVRDTQPTGVTDRRPAILIENDRGNPGKAQGDALATHDGQFRVDAQSRTTTRGLNVRRAPGDGDTTDLISVGPTNNLGQRPPCGDPEETWLRVDPTGQVHVGDKVTISPEGFQCLGELTEEPDAPAEGTTYLYVFDGGLRLWIGGEGSSAAVATGSGGGGGGTTIHAHAGSGEDLATTISSNTQQGTALHATTLTVTGTYSVYPALNGFLAIHATGDVDMGDVTWAGDGRGYQEPA